MRVRLPHVGLPVESHEREFVLVRIAGCIRRGALALSDRGTLLAPDLHDLKRYQASVRVVPLLPVVSDQDRKLATVHSRQLFDLDPKRERD